MVKPKIVKGSKGQWKPVFLDPKFFSGSDDLGVLGIEELTDYSLINSKQLTKEKSTAINNASAKEEISKGKKAKKKKPKKKKGGKHIDSASNAEAQESGEDPVGTHNVEESNEFNIDDLTTRMAAWNGLGVPLILLRALAEKSFLSPTRIQALTLPAAIFGRRDILGAAETGSGKTLAFGLPILNGIIEELGKKKSDDETENDVPVSEEEVLNSDLENFDNDDAEDFDGNEDEENDSDEEAAEADDDDDDKEDEDSVDDEEDEENNSLAGSDSDCDEYGNNSGSFGGTAQCVKVIDNITSGFPTVGESNSKTRYTSKPLYALILTPTRELAVQISQHLKTAAKYTTISIAVVVGGLSSQKQERLLNRGPEIVVATPGRLWELIQEGHPHLIKVDTLKYLAVDETDRMLERGHFEELQKLLTRINENEAHRKERQNFVFSATLALTHAPPRYIAQKKGKKKFKKLPGQLTPAQKLDDIMKTVGLSDPKVVDITEGSGVAEMLSEAQIVCALEQKDYYLYYFLQRHPGRTLVFCNSIEAVRRLSQLFSILGCVVWPLHAKMHQKARLKNLERFIASPNGVLLATDVAARGLDIPNVQHVIHYQIPRTAEGYVHRSGRTARAKQQGLTVVFIEPSEVIKFKRLFRTLSRDPDLPMFPVESEWMATIKERVHLARRLDKLELRTRRENSEQGWLDKAVKEMDILVSDDELPTSDSDDEGSNNAKKEAAVLRKQLNILLSKPVIPRGFSGKFPTQTGKLVVPLLPGAMSSNSEICKGTAVDALKQSVEDEKSEKRKRNNKRANLNKRKKRQRISKAAEEGSTQVMKAVTRTKSVKKSI